MLTGGQLREFEKRGFARIHGPRRGLERLVRLAAETTTGTQRICAKASKRISACHAWASGRDQPDHEW